MNIKTLKKCKNLLKVAMKLLNLINGTEQVLPMGTAIK